MQRDVDRMSRELACLLELGVLSAEETGALTRYLEELRRLLGRARAADAPAPLRGQRAAPDLAELSGMLELLADDLDLAFCRLGAAA